MVEIFYLYVNVNAPPDAFVLNTAPSPAVSACIAHTERACVRVTCYMQNEHKVDGSR